MEDYHSLIKNLELEISNLKIQRINTIVQNKNTFVFDALLTEKEQRLEDLRKNDPVLLEFQKAREQFLLNLNKKDITVEDLSGERELIEKIFGFFKKILNHDHDLSYTNTSEGINFFFRANIEKEIYYCYFKSYRNFELDYDFSFTLKEETSFEVFLKSIKIINFSDYSSHEEKSENFNYPDNIQLINLFFSALEKLFSEALRNKKT